MPRIVDLEAVDYALPPDVLARTQTPVLVIDLERVRANVARMIALVGDVQRWRPHVKTTKMPEVWAELARAGVKRFKCATTREARFLAETLARLKVAEADVCVAYPLREPALGAVATLARERPEVRLSVLCEDPDLEVPAELGVFVDINLGMDRTGVPAGEPEPILAIARRAGGRFRGVHGYEGHLHDGAPEALRAAAFACYDRLLELVELLEIEGIAVGEIVTSGTPGFRAALEYEPFARRVHTVSPGTVVFHDARSEEQNGDIGLVPAAVVVSRVISRPAQRLATCDAGSKAIAAEAGDPCAVIVGRAGLVAQTPSEEHLPLRGREGEMPERGEVLALVPRHVCPTVNLAEEALVVDGGEVRRVLVSGRGHDL